LEQQLVDSVWSAVATISTSTSASAAASLMAARL
jgi:hypothetical protein